MNQSLKNSFFILGCGRSGTTAMAKILSISENANVFSEENPKLCIASRQQYEKVLPYPENFIYKSLVDNITLSNKSNKIYGNKNINYLYFLKELYSSFNSKFIFVVRDGRDVVRSAINFDKNRKSNYYRYEDGMQYTLTQPEDDFWEYSRLRPLPSNSIYTDWRKMTKFEKFSWYWAEYNKLLIDYSKTIPSDSFMFFDITSATNKDYRKAFDFLGLEGFDTSQIAKLTSQKINTSISKIDDLPIFKEWSIQEKEIFSKYTNDIMNKLGYDID